MRVLLCNYHVVIVVYAAFIIAIYGSYLIAHTVAIRQWQIAIPYSLAADSYAHSYLEIAKL